MIYTGNIAVTNDNKDNCSNIILCIPCLHWSSHWSMRLHSNAMVWLVIDRRLHYSSLFWGIENGRLQCQWIRTNVYRTTLQQILYWAVWTIPVTLMYRGGDKHWFEKADFRSNHLTGLVAEMTALCRWVKTLFTLFQLQCGVGLDHQTVMLLDHRKHDRKTTMRKSKTLDTQ